MQQNHLASSAGSGSIRYRRARRHLNRPAACIWYLVGARSVRVFARAREGKCEKLAGLKCPMPLFGSHGRVSWCTVAETLEGCRLFNRRRATVGSAGASRDGPLRGLYLLLGRHRSLGMMPSSPALCIVFVPGDAGLNQRAADCASGAG